VLVRLAAVGVKVARLFSIRSMIANDERDTFPLFLVSRINAEVRAAFPEAAHERAEEPFGLFVLRPSSLTKN